MTQIARATRSISLRSASRLMRRSSPLQPTPLPAPAAPDSRRTSGASSSGGRPATPAGVIGPGPAAHSAGTCPRRRETPATCPRGRTRRTGSRRAAGQPSRRARLPLGLAPVHHLAAAPPAGIASRLVALGERLGPLEAVDHGLPDPGEPLHLLKGDQVVVGLKVGGGGHGVLVVS